jgi:hypothetical protein
MYINYQKIHLSILELIEIERKQKIAGISKKFIASDPIIKPAPNLFLKLINKLF